MDGWMNSRPIEKLQLNSEFLTINAISEDMLCTQIINYDK